MTAKVRADYLCFVKGWLVFVFLGGLCLLNPAHALERHAGHGGPVKHLTVSANGQWLVSTSFDYSAVLWSLPDFKEQRRLIAHEAAVNAAAFSPDGAYLATAGDDETIRIWRMARLLDPSLSPQPEKLTGHTGKIVHLAFSPDGTKLASSSWDRSIGLWSVPDFDNLSMLGAHDAPVNMSQFSTDSHYLYSGGGDGRILLWSVEQQRYIKSLINHGWGINAMAIDEDHDLIAFGAANGVMKLGPLYRDGETTVVLSEGKPVLSMQMRADMSRLVFANAEGRIVVLDTTSRRVLHDFHATQGPVWALVLLPDTTSLAFAGLDDYFTQMPLYGGDAGSEARQERRFHPIRTLSNGERQFARKCSICHTLSDGDGRRAGPSLLGVFGRQAGSVAGYTYSPALIKADLVWNEQTIDALFRDGPDIVTPGSKMPMQRIPDQKNRRDLIDYLKENTQ